MRFGRVIWPAWLGPLGCPSAEGLVWRPGLRAGKRVGGGLCSRAFTLVGARCGPYGKRTLAAFWEVVEWARVPPTICSVSQAHLGGSLGRMGCRGSPNDDSIDRLAAIFSGLRRMALCSGRMSLKFAELLNLQVSPSNCSHCATLASGRAALVWAGAGQVAPHFELGLCASGHTEVAWQRGVWLLARPQLLASF